MAKLYPESTDEAVRLAIDFLDEGMIELALFDMDQEDAVDKWLRKAKKLHANSLKILKTKTTE